MLLSAAPLHGATDGNVADSVVSLSQSATVKGWIQGGLTQRFRSDAATGNPAAMPSFLPFSTTSLGAVGQLAATGRTQPVESGTGEMTGDITAASYRHLGNATTVWGNARFHAGKIKDVAWSNSADYELTGPYVIGDPTGGDLTCRSYDFGGGYAGESGRWTWGVEASYRAEIDYRGRDPRDKIIVSDLRASLGGSFRPATSRLAIGLSGEVRVYNQNAAVEFYNPVNDIPTYAMTGLGSYYPRFSGNSGRNTAYSGVGFGVAADLFPIGQAPLKPIRARLEASTMSLRQYMRDFNNLELTHTTTSSLSGEYGMLFGELADAAGNVAYGFTVSGQFSRKTGTENLLGTSTGNTYPKIGERENYHRSVFNARVTLPVETHPSGNDRLGLSVAAAFGSISESINEPLRKVSATHTTPSLRGDWWHRFHNGAFLAIGMEVCRRFTTPGTVRLDGLTADTPLGMAVERNVAIITSDVTSYGVSARMEFPLVDSASLYVKAHWNRDDFSRRCGSADYASVAVGINL